MSNDQSINKLGTKKKNIRLYINKWKLLVKHATHVSTCQSTTVVNLLRLFIFLVLSNWVFCFLKSDSRM